MNVHYIHRMNLVCFNSFFPIKYCLKNIFQISLDLAAISSKSASLRPTSLYFQRRVPRSTSNPDLPSPSISPEEEIAAAGSTANTGSFHLNICFYFKILHLCLIIEEGLYIKSGNEPTLVNVKDGTNANKSTQQRKVIFNEILIDP